MLLLLLLLLNRPKYIHFTPLSLIDLGNKLIFYLSL